MWTISDFPAYKMLYEWSIAGKQECPHCMSDSEALLYNAVTKHLGLTIIGSFYLKSTHYVAIDKYLSAVEECCTQRQL